MADKHGEEPDERQFYAGTYLPKGTKIFNQVAGHEFGNGELGILRDSDGYILKPVNNFLKGKREIDFYENLQTNVSPDIVELRSFVPKFMGTVCLQVNDKDVTFIRLEDVTAEFIKPCVMDVKIGRQTWEPDASEHKQMVEDSKYVESKRNFGFSIAGFYVHSLNNYEFKKYGKDYGRQLNKNTVPVALKIFLNSEAGLNKNIVEIFVRKLQKIEKWFDSQQILAFYSSSILLLYDAYNLTPTSDVDESMVKAVMIDFAHVVNSSTYDSNYIHGLKNLISVFKSFIC